MKRLITPRGGSYATFAVGHLVAGAIASISLSDVVRNTSIVGIIIGALVVAVPAYEAGMRNIRHIGNQYDVSEWKVQEEIVFLTDRKQEGRDG